MQNQSDRCELTDGIERYGKICSAGPRESGLPLTNCLKTPNKADVVNVWNATQITRTSTFNRLALCSAAAPVEIDT